jgi:hypothetical protein
MKSKYTPEEKNRLFKERIGRILEAVKKAPDFVVPLDMAQIEEKAYQFVDTGYSFLSTMYFKFDAAPGAWATDCTVHLRFSKDEGSDTGFRLEPEVTWGSTERDIVSAMASVQSYNSAVSFMAQVSSMFNR